jgi:BASS family bile acid:Na+ symporter
LSLTSPTLSPAAAQLAKVSKPSPPAISLDNNHLKVLQSSTSSIESRNNNKLDQVLSRLTSAFPFFVLGSAILGLAKPSTLLWTNKGTLISWMLASVMCATGLTLEKKDFANVLSQDLAAVPAGVLCQASKLLVSLALILL